jgi:hypothetical protein
VAVPVGVLLTVAVRVELGVGDDRAEVGVEVTVNEWVGVKGKEVHVDVTVGVDVRVGSKEVVVDVAVTVAVRAGVKVAVRSGNWGWIGAIGVRQPSKIHDAIRIKLMAR